jgi:hypothetical protein
LAPAHYLASLGSNRKALIETNTSSEAYVDTEIRSTAALLQQHNPSARLPGLDEPFKASDIIKACQEPQVDNFLSKVTVHQRAVVRGQMQKHAYEWKIASHTSEFFMEGAVFQNCANLSIGADVFSDSSLCPCCAKKTLDSKGAHALTCMSTGDVVHRHHALRDIFVAETQLAGVAVSKELTLQLTSKMTYRPDFLFSQPIPGYTKHITAFDVVVQNNFAKYLIGKCASEPLAAAKAAEGRKDKERDDELRALGVDFIPVAFEVTGGHTTSIDPVVNYLMRQKALLTGEPFADHLAHFWQLISVTLQSHVGAAIQKRRIVALEERDETETFPRQVVDRDDNEDSHQRAPLQD